MTGERPGWLSEADLARARALVPIVCVDVLLLDAVGWPIRVGLIRRRSPWGDLWCWVGGRVHRGEGLGEALGRHVRETLGAEVDPSRAQLAAAVEFFPGDLFPMERPGVGLDPRQHGVSLVYTIEVADLDAQPRGEAIEFRWHPADGLPELIWPGVGSGIRRVLGGGDLRGADGKPFAEVLGDSALDGAKV